MHRLVAEAFIPNPDSKPHVAHNNGDPADNRVSNLRWATAKENNADKWAHGTQQSKLTPAQASEIRRLYQTGDFTQLDLANRFGVSRTTAQAVIHGRTFQHADLAS